VGSKVKLLDWRLLVLVLVVAGGEWPWPVAGESI
jgi:hypothetical protein